MKPDVVVKHQRRKTLALKVTPMGFIAVIPVGLSADSNRVQRFIETGLRKLDFGSLPDFPSLSPDDLRARVDAWAKHIGVRVRRVQIRAMNSKWASCSANGTLTLNADVLELPPDLVDYVLCHDLLHLKLPDHGKGFRAMMGSYLPGWRKRELELAKWLTAPSADVSPLP